MTPPIYDELAGSLPGITCPPGADDIDPGVLLLADVTDALLRALDARGITHEYLGEAVGEAVAELEARRLLVDPRAGERMRAFGDTLAFVRDHLVGDGDDVALKARAIAAATLAAGGYLPYGDLRQAQERAAAALVRAETAEAEVQRLRDRYECGDATGELRTVPAPAEREWAASGHPPEAPPSWGTAGVRTTAPMPRMGPAPRLTQGQRDVAGAYGAGARAAHATRPRLGGGPADAA